MYEILFTRVEFFVNVAALNNIKLSKKSLLIQRYFIRHDNNPQVLSTAQVSGHLVHW